ncbi:TasA family protein [Chloroflexota bacterium]
MWKYVLAGVLAIGVLSFGVRAATMALFTSTASVGANEFTTGTLDITTNPTTALITFSGMAPGDEVTNPITVTNDGTLEMRYAVTSTTDEDVLAAQLDMTIKTGVSTCTNAEFDTDGAVVYGPEDLGSVAGTDVVGDPTQGADTGDRTLGASANEVLCIQASLPLATGNTFQGLTSTATLAFASEQTANN